MRGQQCEEKRCKTGFEDLQMVTIVEGELVLTGGNGGKRQGS